MFRSSVALLTCATVMLFSETGAAQQSPIFKTSSDVDHFAKSYYQYPRPELVGSLIEALYPTGISPRPNAAPPYIAFFSEIFAANRTRLPEWQAVIEKQDITVKDALARALTLSKEGGVITIALPPGSSFDVGSLTVTRAGGVITVGDRSATANDIYWGAYFASGRTVFLQKLVDQLRYCDERDNPVLFLAGATAKWSLASNAQSDPVVRAILQGSTLTANAQTRAIIADLLVQDPVRIKQDMADIVRKQREAGKWQ